MTESAVPSATDELVRDLIESASRMFDRECGVLNGYFDPALYPVWKSSHAYVVGDIVTPTTPNSHVYRVTTAGTSGSTEATWPTSGTVTNGNVIFTENGTDIVAVQRTFYGDGTNYLKLDPYVSGSLGSVTLPAGYSAPDYVERNGYLIRTGQDHVLPSFRRSHFHFYGWDRGVPVTVTAKWGYESTPADVKAAVIEWVINLWREGDPAGLKLIGMEGQVLREAAPPRVAEIVKFYQVRGASFV